MCPRSSPFWRNAACSRGATGWGATVWGAQDRRSVRAGGPSAALTRPRAGHGSLPPGTPSGRPCAQSSAAPGRPLEQTEPRSQDCGSHTAPAVRSSRTPAARHSSLPRPRVVRSQSNCPPPPPPVKSGKRATDRLSCDGNRSPRGRGAELTAALLLGEADAGPVLPAQPAAPSPRHAHTQESLPVPDQALQAPRHSERPRWERAGWPKWTPGTFQMATGTNQCPLVSGSQAPLL